MQANRRGTETAGSSLDACFGLLPSAHGFRLRPRFPEPARDPAASDWREPAAQVREDLQCAVNGRFTYWMSVRPIPGGVAYENFELRETFRNGQQVAFGVTRRTPTELLK
jgi:hypothetical protein